eukprot:7886228-Pyramimonas_sp.AAC.3
MADEECGGRSVADAYGRFHVAPFSSPRLVPGGCALLSSPVLEVRLVAFALLLDFSSQRVTSPRVSERQSVPLLPTY